MEVMWPQVEEAMATRRGKEGSLSEPPVGVQSYLDAGLPASTLKRNIFLWVYASQLVVIWCSSSRKGAQASYPVGSLEKLSRKSLEVSEDGLGVRKEEAGSTEGVLSILDYDLEQEVLLRKGGEKTNQGEKHGLQQLAELKSSAFQKIQFVNIMGVESSQRREERDSGGKGLIAEVTGCPHEACFFKCFNLEQF